MPTPNTKINTITIEAAPLDVVSINFFKSLKTQILEVMISKMIASQDYDVFAVFGSSFI